MQSVRSHSLLLLGFDHARIGVDPVPGDALDPRSLVLVPSRRFTPSLRELALRLAGCAWSGVVLGDRATLLDPPSSAPLVECSLLGAIGDMPIGERFRSLRGQRLSILRADELAVLFRFIVGLGSLVAFGTLPHVQVVPGIGETMRPHSRGMELLRQ